MKIAVISSEFAAKAGAALTDLRASCFAQLKKLDAQFTEFRVPGTFEIPTAAKKILLSQKFDAVIALGVIVRGETIHFELVAENCARKLADLGVEFVRPVIFGILTTETTAQAETRATRGAEFASTAVQLAQTLADVEDATI